LATAVSRLLDDDAARDRLAQCGRERADLFTVDAMVAGMRAAYDELRA
jgi:glycosyltransferase involved in cell wall biosynthesis